MIVNDPVADVAAGAGGEAMTSLRMLVPMTDREIEELFRRLGYAARIDDLVFTAETIDDFWFARYESWDDPGTVARRESGLLIVKGARPRGSSRPRDVVVIGFIMVRAVLGVDREPGELFADLPQMPVARTLLLAIQPAKEPA